MSRLSRYGHATVSSDPGNFFHPSGRGLRAARSLPDAKTREDHAQQVIRRLKEEAAGACIDDRGTVFNQDVLGAIELGYMLDCAEAIVLGALERRESRGAQFRLDYPERNDDEWLKHITISMNGGDAPRVDYAPVTMTQWEPQERTY